MSKTKQDGKIGAQKAAAQLQRLRATRDALEKRRVEIVTELDALAVELLAAHDAAANVVHERRLALLSEILALPMQIGHVQGQVSIALLYQGKARQAAIDEEIAVIELRRGELAATAGGDDLEAEMRTAGVAALDRKIAERRQARSAALGGYTLSGLTEHDAPDIDDPGTWPVGLRNEQAARSRAELKKVRGVLMNI